MSFSEFFVLEQLLQVHAKGNKIGIGIDRGQPIQATTKPEDYKRLQGQDADVADVEGKRLSPFVSNQNLDVKNLQISSY